MAIAYFLLGAVVDQSLYLTPIAQDFELLFWISIVESELTFFEEQREGCFMNTIVLSQHALGLAPKVFDAVDVIFIFGKVRGMVDALMLKAAHVKGVKGIVGTVGVRIDKAVRLDFAGNNGHQCLGFVLLTTAV